MSEESIAKKVEALFVAATNASETPNVSLEQVYEENLVPDTDPEQVVCVPVCCSCRTCEAVETTTPIASMYCKCRATQNEPHRL